MLKRLLPLVILILGIVSFMALRYTRPEPAPVEAQERRWPVEALTVSPSEHVPLLSLFGEVVAPDMVTLVAPVQARVAQRPVSDGQRVAQGELLIALDEDDLSSPLRQAEAELADLQAQLENERIRHENNRQVLAQERTLLASANRQLERNRSLEGRNLTSQTDVDTARDAVARAQLNVSARESAIAEYPSRLASLEARLARAQVQAADARRSLERGRVHAPFAGSVTRVQVAEGDDVAPRAALLSLYPLDGLELRARIPQPYHAELEAHLPSGAPLEATATNGNQHFVLERLAGESDPTGTEAILSVQGQHHGLRPGAMVAVQLRRPGVKNAVAVPYSALHGADLLYRINHDNRLERQRVERLGEAAQQDGERWLLVRAETLEAGDRVMSTHLPNAVHGLPVEVIQPLAGAEATP
ncbi:biotin/lipoyl-binding protein [Halomonas sp. XH26]|uniref:efflux RND transporter periplasmic adaptor subunit n=1 Tax=Halomonas sp. XH26 TaxID=2557993 RepID=UPI00209CC42B|nr:HlyD family efflux transporter periplasmic adaptor subunit [Halomonas sp. XH26]UTA79681.1 biotin/lipoyl-binding protein [Halomonas sp. XH26]